MDAVSRNERRLMRQRGAGTRNINNIEFGLSFPTPTNARRSKTPSTGRRAPRITTKTPARRSASQEPTATAIPEASTVSRPSKRKSSFLDAVTEGPAPETGKKRRFNDAAETPWEQNKQKSNAVPSDRRSIPTRRASRKAGVSTIAAEANDVEDLAQVVFDEAGVAEVPEEPFLDDEEDKENDEPNSGPLQVKHKKRKSIARRFSKPKKRSSTGSLQDEAAEKPHEVLGQASTRRDDSTAGPSAAPTLAVEGTEFPLSVRYQHSVAIPTKAPSSDEPSTVVDDAALSTIAKTKASREASLQTVDDNLEEEEWNLSLQARGPSKKKRKRKSIIVKKRNGRRAPAQFTASASPVPRPLSPQAHTISPTPIPYREPLENEDETYLPEEISPEPPTPAPTKKAHQNARTIPRISSNEAASTSHRSTSSEPRSGFPITTHRLVNTSALPTITEENEAGSEDDLEQLHASRTAPNAVDVLAQICRESVASALTVTHSRATGSSLKNRTDALEAFGHELETRLFDMSAAVENRLTLEGRVRGSQREKSAVQSRWVEVRRQREEVALTMDAVRREHWEGEERGAQSWRVSEACFGVGVILEREKGTEEEGLEGLLGSVARGVSGFEGGGTLQTVKGFNTRMEAMLHVLEEAAQ